MRRAAVLFDFDGTLIDTWRLYLEAFRRSLAPHFGRFLTDDEILALKPSAERRLLEGIVSPDRLTDYFEQFLLHYDTLHESHCDGLYPGVADMLRTLRDEGYRVGIVTGKSRAAWELTCQASRLPSFDVIITDNDVLHPKPHAEGIKAALTALDVRADQALFVGDSVLDCQAARSAGIPFAAALWSKTPVHVDEFLSAVAGLGASLYFSHPTDVLASMRESAFASLMDETHGTRGEPS